MQAQRSTPQVSLDALVEDYRESWRRGIAMSPQPPRRYPAIASSGERAFIVLRALVDDEHGINTCSDRILLAATNVSQYLHASWAATTEDVVPVVVSAPRSLAPRRFLFEIAVVLHVKICLPRATTESESRFVGGAEIVARYFAQHLQVGCAEITLRDRTWDCEFQ